MGQHRFADLPDQARRIQAVYPGIVSEGLFGVAEGCDLPIALWRARDGFEVDHPSNAHLTLSVVRGGAHVERLDGRFAGRLGYADRASFMPFASHRARMRVRVAAAFLGRVPPGGGHDAGRDAGAAAALIPMA